MQLRQLSEKLIEGARSNVPADAVPYAFEQRVMAHIRGIKPVDAWAIWSAGLWRAALACLLLTLLSGAWSVWGEPDSAPSIEFAQEFETAVAVPETQFYDLW